MSADVYGSCTRRARPFPHERAGLKPRAFNEKSFTACNSPCPQFIPAQGAPPLPPDDFPAAVIVDESLSLTDNERELIQRALKKHKNKRKDAAFELGISERTLYRKIKEYNIKE